MSASMPTPPSTAQAASTPKRVLVTGGAQRLGALLCRTFASAGWEVWCHYQRSGALAEALVHELRGQGFAAHTVQADLEQDAQRQAMMAKIAAHGVAHGGAQGGALHCLVNNASLFEEDGATQLDLALVRRQMEVNLLAPLALSALMAEQVTTCFLAIAVTTPISSAGVMATTRSSMAAGMTS